MKELQQIREEQKKLFQRWDENLEKRKRIIRVVSQADGVLEEIDEKFKMYTGLNRRDIAFLFIALALQVARQYLFTKIPERLDDQAAAKKVKGKHEEHSNRHHRYYNPSLEEIITNPVPFDASYGAAGALKQGGRLGHRLTAIGHDPILGLIFGTSNIATATLTNNRFESYHIITGSKKVDTFGNKANTTLVLSKTADKLFCEGATGKKIVGTSLIKELVHLKSDIYTKNSLPLPILSVTDPRLAITLAEYGIDMGNVVPVAGQMVWSGLIDILIGMLHGALYDESIDGSRKMYEVRTRKILCTSNVIASSSNLVMVAGNIVPLNSLDYGGVVKTLFRIATDVNYIRKVKETYILEQWQDYVDEQLK